MAAGVSRLGNSTIFLSDDSIQWEAFDTGFIGIWVITARPAGLYAIDKMTGGAFRSPDWKS